jgi:deoxyribodipyrimidine photo-lyase
VSSSRPPTTIFWFRRDLRLEDNIGLAAALDHGSPVSPIFIFDTDILSKLDRDDARVSFIHALVKDLDLQLREHSSSLEVHIGKPIEVFTKLIKSQKVDAVYTNHDYEPYARRRDEEIELLLEENGIAFHTYKDQVVFEKDEVLKLDRTPYSVFTPYKKKWLETLDPRDLHAAKPKLDKFVHRKIQTVPSVEQIGFKEQPTISISPAVDLNLIRKYDQTRDTPSVVGTTHLGAHLRFGTVSVRKLAKLAQKENQTWLSELIWREFFSQILYHYPHVVKHPFRPEYEKIEWRHSKDDFKRWTEGTTGYPLVDAGMRELRETGFMHNRVRMVTASFLVKHLLINWQEGEHYFAKLLYDFDLASNNGNWQWVAGSGCDAAPYFRVFNPTLQMKRFDPKQLYIKKWVPEFGTGQYPEPMVDHEEARARRGPETPGRIR